MTIVLLCVAITAVQLYTAHHGTVLTEVHQIYCATLNAVVILELAKQNEIRSLSAAEAIPMLLPRLFLPYYNPILWTEPSLKNADRDCRSIPIYHLKCRADRMATELVRQCI